MKDSSCGHLGHQPHPLPHPRPSPPSWGPLGPGRWVWGTRQRHSGWRGWGWGACTALTPEENSWTSEFRSLGAGNLGGVFPHGGSVLRTWKRLCFGCIWLNRAVRVRIHEASFCFLMGLLSKAGVTMEPACAPTPMALPRPRTLLGRGPGCIWGVLRLSTSLLPASLPPAPSSSS